MKHTRTITLLGLIACILAACSPKRASDLSEPQLEQGVARLKRQWESETTDFFNGPHFMNIADERVAILKRLLKDSPSSVMESEFDRVCSGPVPLVRTQELDYDRALVETFISLAVDQKTSEKLMRLLSMNCPYAVGFVPLEGYLGEAWDDAIPLLCDAFKQAKNPAAKDAILLSLSHAFSTLRAKFKDDDEFIEQARRWYLENRRTVEVNPNYPYFGQRPAFSEPDEKDLFLPAKK